MSEVNKPPEDSPEDVNPIEIELNFLSELIGENIIIFVHQNGITIMMDEDLEERSKDQMKLFSRLYVASKPSFVLNFFLTIELFMLLISDYLEDKFKKYFKK